MLTPAIALPLLAALADETESSVVLGAREQLHMVCLEISQGHPLFRLNLDVGGSYRLAPRLSGFFSVRNVLNQPFIIMERSGNNPAAAQFFQKFGITPTIGVKTTF